MSRYIYYFINHNCKAIYESDDQHILSYFKDRAGNLLGPYIEFEGKWHFNDIVEIISIHKNTYNKIENNDWQTNRLDMLIQENYTMI